MGMKGMFFVIILGLTTSSFSQVIQVIETTEEGDLPAIVTVALDPKRDNNYAVITSDGHIASTIDGGEKWVNRHIDAITAGSSWLFSDKKGNLYNFGLSNGKFFSSTSGDQGVTWKPEGEFAFENLDGRPTLYFHPAKENIFMSYVSTNDCVSEVVFQQSKNTKKWSSPVTLNNKGVTCDGAVVSPATITLDSRGFLYALWWQNNQILMDRSFDGGEKWLRTDIKFKDVTGDFEFGIPRLTADRSMGMLRGSLYALWTLNKDGKSQVLAARSANQGDFWTPSVPVSMEDGAMFPILQLDQSNGIVYVAYWNKLEDGEYDVYLAFSIDGAQTFKSIKMNETPVNSEESTLYRSLALSVLYNRIIVAWSSEENTTRKYFANVTSYGEVSESSD
jgi:hypothetical protein